MRCEDSVIVSIEYINLPHIEWTWYTLGLGYFPMCNLRSLSVLFIIVIYTFLFDFFDFFFAFFHLLQKVSF